MPSRDNNGANASFDIVGVCCSYSYSIMTNFHSQIKRAIYTNNMKNMDFTSHSQLFAAAMLWLVCYGLSFCFGTIVFTDPKLFNSQQNINFLFPIVSVICLLLPQRFSNTMLFLSGPVGLALPMIGSYIALSSFMKGIKIVRIVSIVLASLITILTAPLVVMDFVSGSTISREEPLSFGNKNVATYVHKAFRLRDYSESLCVESTIFPGVCLSKEIYSEPGPIRFRKIDEKHIEIDVSCGRVRTLAI